MRRARWLTLALLLVGSSADLRDAYADGGLLELEGPTQITQLRRLDVNGDGVTDLVLGAGRSVLIWAGAHGKLPAAAPTWRYEVPPDDSFIDIHKSTGDEAPTLMLLGREGLRYLPEGGTPEVPKLAAMRLGWAEAERVTFLEMRQRDGALLLPTGVGWELYPKGRPAVHMPVEIDAHVGEAGAFLEDTTSTTIAYPAVVRGQRPWGPKVDSLPTLWALSGRTLVAQTDAVRTTYDLSFLPRNGDRRILDLDLDGRPDVVHRTSTNFEGSYVFFKTPAAPLGPDGKPEGAGPRPGPANTSLRLSGNQIEHDYVDLDGDGRLDFVATTIDVDGKNAVAALTSGRVRAQTRAFLNRSGTAAKHWFADEADATVTSEVGVRILWTYAGQLDVQRQLTIVVDGDYDGDGRLDLAIRTGPETLTIWPGRKAGGWAAEGRTVAIPPLGAYANIEGYAYDADGDGKDEVFLLYRAVHRDGSGTEKRERLFLVSPAK